jgi:DNA-directed RNA polymerase specialized sigma24 family protein
MYVEKERLKELVIDAQANGVSNEFALALMHIMAGAHQSYVKYGTFYTGKEVEDFQQDFVIRIMKHVHLIDVEQNIFSYLTQIAVNIIKATRKSAKSVRLVSLHSEEEEGGIRKDQHPVDTRAPFVIEYSYPEKKYRGVHKHRK